MINFDTYVTLLFAIIIPAIGLYITIVIGDFTDTKKRHSLFILFFSSFILIIIATLLFCYKRYFEILIQRQVLTTNMLNSNIKYFYISYLFPFTKPQFSDPSFCEKYIMYFVFSFVSIIGVCNLILIECGDTNIKCGIVIFNIKYARLSLLFYLFIGTYVHLWFVYELCYFSFHIFINIIISYVLGGIEYGILYYINKYLTYRKLNY